MHPGDRVLDLDITSATEAVVNTALAEATRQVTAVLDVALPGTERWHAEAPEQARERQVAADLLSLRILLRVGLDTRPSVMNLRRAGVSWTTIGRAANCSRQAAHERWGPFVRATLDRYGTGMPDSVLDDDPS